jgi:hypothetical protein
VSDFIEPVIWVGSSGEDLLMNERYRQAEEVHRRLIEDTQE